MGDIGERNRAIHNVSQFHDSLVQPSYRPGAVSPGRTSSYSPGAVSKAFMNNSKGSVSMVTTPSGMPGTISTVTSDPGSVSKFTSSNIPGTVSNVTTSSSTAGVVSSLSRTASTINTTGTITTWTSPSVSMTTASVTTLSPTPGTVSVVTTNSNTQGTLQAETSSKSVTGTVSTSQVGGRQRGAEKTPRNRTASSCWQHDITYTDVIVIGNGPSGISLSYLLSGHWPYYTGAPHSNEYLHLRLQNEGSQKSIVEMDLEYLSSGLEGRSSNPLALLFDNLTHPDADTGMEKDSLLRWTHDADKVIPHIVLGHHAAGGAWQMMEGEMQTLSLGNWMQLPNLPFKEWLAQYRTMMQEKHAEYYLPPIQNRASMDEVCSYYMDYVKRQGLQSYFRDHSTVTSVERVLDMCHTVDDESGEQQPCSRDHSSNVKWEVRGHRTVTDSCGETEVSEFCYRAPNVVLATGSYDTPNKLGIPGENHDYVLHSLGCLETVIKQGRITPDSDPVMIVGAGLSAADAILCAQNCQIPVVHVFRRDVKDPRIVLRQLPAVLYPEYHHVLQMMQQGEDVDYLAHSQHQVLECLEDGKVLLQDKVQGCEVLIKVSFVVVLVGSRPNLSFLPQEGKNIGVVPGMNIDPKNNPVDVDAFSHQSIYECGLYAMGPLVGDNFVRFLRGGALGIASHLVRKKEGAL